VTRARRARVKRSHEDYTIACEVLADLPGLIASERAHRGVSVRRMASECGVGYNTLREIENGNASTRVDTALKIITWLDTPAGVYARAR
jgi:transcriptional regulator with XRE-family HTH domain